ncbi:MAG: dicarboxylate/amino acid:cation symporter [Lachnospiraceae bacterium]|nr:dicarboxylate/amino acid:cation symporter [Lachnospiraceae bacterium]
MKILSKLENIREAMDFIDATLTEKKIGKKEKARTMLAAEEILSGLVNNSTEETYIDIEATGVLGNVSFNFKSKGCEFDIDSITDSLLFPVEKSDDEEANSFIKNLVSKVFGDNISIRHDKGLNKVSLHVKRSSYAALIYTLIGLGLGILVGIILKQAAPEAVSGAISANVFSPIYTLFMNALKLIVGPLVFCSVASSIADFGDLKALGRIALKIVGMYLITSMIAFFVGFGSYNLFPIGDPALKGAVSDAAASTVAASQSANVSIKDMIVGIIPNNIISPFLESNLLQIIFMAVVMGITAAVIAKKMPGLKNGLLTLNKAFSIITSKLMVLMPVVVFCAMAKMMIAMDMSSLGSVLVWIPVNYFGSIVMIGVYMVLLLILARLNPLKFLKKYHKAMITAFTLSSSNATLPTSAKQCDELGVSNKVYSFSLPLGATINMDGTVITLIITSLFMAKIFGATITGGMLLSLFISIMVLSIGSPGVPGGALICITLLLPTIGVPAEAVSIIMGLYPIVSMMQTTVNVTGDATVTAIVARNEKLLNMEKFNS